MKAIELLDDQDRRAYAAMPEMDALTEEGALQEAALVDVRFDVMTRTAAMIFDLRGALQLREGGVAVVVGRDVTRLEWTTHHARSGCVWHAVTGSKPDNAAGAFGLQLFFAPDAELHLNAGSGEFYVGDMAGLEGAPPNFVEDAIEVVRAGMPRWDAVFTPAFATFLDPPRST